MVSSENRAPTAAPPYERQGQATFQPTPEAVTEPRRAEERRPEDLRPVEPMVASLRNPFWFTSVVVAGASIGAMWGLAGVILSILGLANLAPMYMLPVGGIVLGLAFLTLSLIDVAWARMFRFAEREDLRHRVALSTGVSVVAVVGLIAVVLGILNTVFVTGTRFGAVTLIALGLGLLFHSRIMRLVSLFTHDIVYRDLEGRRFNAPFTINALSVAPLRDAIVGAGALILGILALLGIAPMILGLVGLLALGLAATFTVTTICGATLGTLKAACAKHERAECESRA